MLGQCLPPTQTMVSTSFLPVPVCFSLCSNLRIRISQLHIPTSKAFSLTIPAPKNVPRECPKECLKMLMRESVMTLSPDHWSVVLDPIAVFVMIGHPLWNIPFALNFKETMQSPSATFYGLVISVPLSRLHLLGPVSPTPQLI